MNDQTRQVTVYNFWTVDLDSSKKTFSTFKATADAVETLYRSEVIESTGEEVSSEDLDGAGRFRRLPTGWGALSE